MCGLIVHKQCGRDPDQCRDEDGGRVRAKK